VVPPGKGVASSFAADPLRESCAADFILFAVVDILEPPRGQLQ